MSPKILLGLTGIVKFLASEMKITSRKADFLGDDTTFNFGQLSFEIPSKFSREAFK